MNRRGFLKAGPISVVAAGSGIGSTVVGATVPDDIDIDSAMQYIDVDVKKETLELKRKMSLFTVFYALKYNWLEYKPMYRFPMDAGYPIACLTDGYSFKNESTRQNIIRSIWYEGDQCWVSKDMLEMKALEYIKFWNGDKDFKIA